MLVLAIVGPMETRSICQAAGVFAHQAPDPPVLAIAAGVETVAGRVLRTLRRQVNADRAR